MNAEVMFSSKACDWSTPDDFFDKLNEEFNFELDAAASDDNHKCNLYFTKEQDALKQSWRGKRTYCNPPYGREIGKWVEKARKESMAGCVVVMLLPARTDTSWFHDYIYRVAEVRFIRGRLKFGGAKYNAPFPSMVVIFGKENSIR